MFPTARPAPRASLKARLVTASRSDPGALDQCGEIVRGRGATISSSSAKRLGVRLRAFRRCSSSASANRARKPSGSSSTARRSRTTASSSLAARRLHPGGQQYDVAVVGRKHQRALDRRGGGVELAKSQLRQSQVGPRGRLLGHDGGRLRELLPGIVEESDFEGGESPVEGPSHLLVGLRSRRWEARDRALASRRNGACSGKEHQGEDDRDRARVLRHGLRRPGLAM